MEGEMTKVKIFSYHKHKGLEKSINKFLSSNYVTLIDIKYSSADYTFSALVIYKVNLEEE